MHAGKRVAVPGGGSTYGELSAKLRKRGVQVAMELPFSTPEEREQALEVLRSGEAE